MENEELKIGDVVYLKSNGVAMTIKNNNAGNYYNDILILCSWFVDSDLKEGYFAKEQLTKEKPNNFMKNEKEILDKNTNEIIGIAIYTIPDNEIKDEYGNYALGNTKNVEYDNKNYSLDEFIKFLNDNDLK